MTLSNYLSKKMWAMQNKKKRRSMLKSMIWISASSKKNGKIAHIPNFKRERVIHKRSSYMKTTHLHILDQIA
jgi:hypothetical protein